MENSPLEPGHGLSDAELVQRYKDLGGTITIIPAVEDVFEPATDVKPTSSLVTSDEDRSGNLQLTNTDPNMRDYGV